jgi:integrase/recombinase XerD
MGRRTNKLSTADLTVQATAEVHELDDFDTALHTFIRDCKIRNLSEHTLKSYRQELKSFRNMLEVQGVDTKPSRITKKVVKDNVILYMMDKLGSKEVSINTRLRTIRTFFNWLTKESFILRSPMEGMSLIKQKKTIIETFSRDQLRLILAQSDKSTFTGVRDYTLMLLLVETGVRAREVCGIRLGDINWQDSVIRIDGKGYKERFVPMQTTMKRQLSKYIAVRGETDTDTLFITVDNTPLSKRRVQEAIALYGRKSNIQNVRCSPHTFRHTFAKMSVQNGADVFALQAVLGHTSLEMVRNYVNLFSSDVFEKHKKFSPVEKLF